MTVGKTDEIKQELARKAENTKAGTKLKKSMSIADMIKVMEPQIKKALPEVITPERFTRMALSALNTTPKLNECTPMSFLAALMNAAQLGLEPNTPLGQAFLIPYNNKGEMECQFQLGYKGLIDLSYRNPNMQIITAHTVYENDEFEYELGLNPCLNHRPTLGERGEIRLFYGLFKLTNGGFGFEVMSKTAMDDFAKEYSKNFDSSFSPFVRKNPAKGISVKRDEKKEPRVLSVEEQYDFFECSKGTFYDNFFDVAVTTGMRLGEIAALTWDDIDLERRIISVTKTLVYIKYEGDLGKTFHMETPKTRTSVREIPINKQCELALKKQYAQKKVIESKAPVSKKPKEEFQNLLFTTKFNTPLNSQIIIDAIHKIVLTINETRYYIEEMEDFSCHCFRHTFATRCFEAGIQPKTVQKYLGHATLQMTMDLYTAVMPKHLSSEMEKLDDELEKISQSGEKLIDSRYKKEKQNDVITFPGNTLVV